MKLFYREVGAGKPLVILHGLYGSSDNWMSIAKKLSCCFHLYLVDQRNHGQSPHSNSHTYADMVADLYEFVKALKIEHFYLMGHSMGGRTAMLFQSTYPEMVEKLIVVDVAPWSYHPEDEWFRFSYSEHVRIIDALLSLNLESITSRMDADNQLAQFLPSITLRQFLLKNLKRDGSKFYWGLNLKVLEKNLENLLLGISINSISASRVPVLFFKGEESNYIPKEQIDLLKKYYPNCECVTIRHAGHWLHSEQPNAFVSEVEKFLSVRKDI